MDRNIAPTEAEPKPTPQAGGPLAFLESAGHALAASSGYEQTLWTAVRLPVPALADAAALFLRETDGTVRQVAEAAAVAGHEELLGRQRALPAAENGLVSSALSSGRPQQAGSADGASEAAWARAELLRGMGVQAMLAVPLRAGDAVVGAMTLLRSRTKDEYAPHEVRLLEEVGRRAGLAIQHARALRETERARERVSRLLSLSLALSRPLAPEQVIELILAEAAAALGTRSGCVYVPLQGGQSLALLGGQGTAGDWVARHSIVSTDDHLPVAEAARTQEPVFVQRLADDGEWQRDAAAGAREVAPPGALAALPLTLEARLLGVLVFTFPAPREFAPDEREFLRALAQECAKAFERARLFADAQAMRLSRERERHLMDQVLHELPCGVVLMDPAGRILQSNARMDELLGEPVPKGATLADLSAAVKAIRADGEPVLVNDWALHRAVAGGERVAAEEFEVVRRDGANFIAQISAAPLRDAAGAIVGVVACVVEATGQRLTLERARLYEESLAARGREEVLRKEAELATRLKDDFLATISHEMRTPLTAILGWARLLELKPGDAELRERGLRIIQRNARAQAQLVEDLLDLSRIAAGKLRVDFAPFQLASVVEAAVEALRPGAAAKGLTLELAALAQPTPVVGDQGRLQQVVWNLLANAIKFTPTGGRVEVLLDPGAASHRLVVRDTGCGIEPAFLPQLFRRFQQADPTLTREHGGLGLGLALVRHFVELHGGTVAAESAGPGKGAAFIVTLPARTELPALRPEERAPSQQAAASPSPPPLDGLRILVVEDDADAREMLRTLLEGYGAEVTAVGSAAEGFVVLSRGGTDLLLSDIAMPGEDGYSFIRRVREAGHALPAAALTASALLGDRERAIAAGFQLHLAKPVDPGELAAAIRSLAPRAGSAALRG